MSGDRMRSRGRRLPRVEASRPNLGRRRISWRQGSERSRVGPSWGRGGNNCRNEEKRVYSPSSPGKRHLNLRIWGKTAKESTGDECRKRKGGFLCKGGGSACANLRGVAGRRRGSCVPGADETFCIHQVRGIRRKKKSGRWKGKGGLPSPSITEKRGGFYLNPWPRGVRCCHGGRFACCALETGFSCSLPREGKFNLWVKGGEDKQLLRQKRKRHLAQGERKRKSVAQKKNTGGEFYLLGGSSFNSKESQGAGPPPLKEVLALSEKGGSSSFEGEGVCKERG